MFAFLKNTVYVRIKPEWLSVIHLESRKEFSDIPTLAIERIKSRHVIIGVGREAVLMIDRLNVTVKNGFKHPRTLIADFTIAERTLKHFLKKAMPSSLFMPSPVMIMHPLSHLEGGLTQVEIRAFAELGSAAGARQVYVWQGRELSHEELRELRFSHTAGELLHPVAA